MLPHSSGCSLQRGGSRLTQSWGTERCLTGRRWTRWDGRRAGKRAVRALRRMSLEPMPPRPPSAGVDGWGLGRLSTGVLIT